MTDETRTGDTTDSDAAERPQFNTSRRRIMQVAGGLGAAGVVGGTASAQQSSDNTIRLNAVQQPAGGDPNFDVDGDGTVSYNDVVTFFEEFDEPRIRNNPQQYDFNRNGRLDFDDVVTLFEEIDGVEDGEYAWLGVSPESISGTSNPTLSLTPGETYTVEWTNTAGGENDFVIADADGNELVTGDTTSEQGATGTVEFTASEEMAVYYSSAHSDTMRGRIETGVPEPSEDMISVLMMGGPAGGSHNAPARQVQITEYMLNRGIEVLYSDRLEDLESDVLHRYDAWIMFDNRQGLSDEQEESIVEFVENGGGFVPIHSASACFTESEAYMNLVGGQFAAHNVSTFTTEYAQPDHPILQNLEPIETEDESYRHTNLNDDINVLAYAQFPESDSIPEYDEGRENGEPWSWTRTQGDGRVFYTAWGHGRGPWAEPGFKTLIENAIRWTTGNEDTIAEDTRVLDPLEFTEANIPYYPPPEGSLLTPEVPEEVGSGTDWERMQRALTPEGTVERTIMPEGFDLEPFVTEADLDGNILDAKFDERGRAWLAITRDYPNELGQNRDTIVVCEDTDGDGRADEITTFAEGLSIPASMVLVDDGVIVAHFDEDAENAGKMVRLLDTDGDGRADDETVLFTGFGTGDTHAGPNELDHGIDNWIWGQVGYSGFSGTIAGEQRDFSSCVYRFKLGDDGEVSDFQIVAELPGNQAGLDFTEEGLAFASVATAGRPSNYLPIPGSYYDLIQGTDPTDFGAASDTNRFLPVTDRVRQVDYHGGYTAATSHAIYTAREYPEKYWNNSAFVGDGTGHILGTFFLHQDGAGYRNHYAHNLAGGTDAWFSPSYVQNGPDGMMWFIDWYNYIYQHNPTPDGFENGPGNAYLTELRDHAVARLFRATYGDVSGYDPMSLADASTSELVDTLDNDNMFWRLKAQRMLVERNATDVIPDLNAHILRDSAADSDGSGENAAINTTAAGAIHALWTLEGLGALDADSGNSESIGAAMDALSYPSSGVVMNALRTMPKTAEAQQAIMDNGLLTHDDSRVAMWALLALAETPSSESVGEAIYEMISTEPNYEDTILVDAASIAAAQHASGFITAYEANEDTSGTPDPEEQPNVFENPSMEEPVGGGGGGSGADAPVGWQTTTYTGSAEFGYPETGQDGSRSVRITSSEGADASWNTTVSVETDTEYTLSAYVKTDSVELVDGSGFGEGPLGATISVEQIANTGSGTQWDTIPDGLTGTNDWTELSTTVNSGDNTELTLNMLYGGYGEATGTAGFDNVSLTDPDGNDVLSNGSFEDDGSSASSPASWSTNTFAGSAEYTYAEEGQDGSRSVRISSSEGADAVWLVSGVEVQPETEYTLSGYIRTENLQTTTEGALGALFNVHTTGYETDVLTGTNEWTEVSTTFTTGADQTTLQINALFGGYGQATGTAWFDNVSLTGPDGNNLLANPSFEEAASGGGEQADRPAGWEPITYNGDAQFTYTSDTARTGEDSIMVTSSEGADASWSQFVDDLEPNAEYRFRAYVRTSDDFTATTGFGVTLNVHSYGQDSLANIYEEPVEDWQRLETTIQTGGNPGTLQFNLLFGGWGFSTGTVWFDDAELKQIGGFGDGLQTVYERVQRHVELSNGGGGGGGGGTDAIDPATTIELTAESNDEWTGAAPSSIDGSANPTLRLQEGAEYTLTWTNENGAPHNFELVDSDDETVQEVDTETISEQGGSQTVTFTASQEVAQYVCRVHAMRMRGDIEIVSGSN